MTKKYSTKYFLNKMRAHRLAISRMTGYKTIDELLSNNQDFSIELVNMPQTQGRDE